MDKILDSVIKKKSVFWEEIARDGAQAKTLLSGKQRVEIANLHSKLFRGNAPNHLVFAAGFISIGKEEVEIVKQVVDEVNDCCLAVNCRSNKKEIDLCVETVKSAVYPRVAIVFPASKSLAKVMLHKKMDEIIPVAIDLAKYAVDKASGIPVDFQLAGSFDTDAEFIAELSGNLFEQGIAINHLGDTRGGVYPLEAKKYFTKLLNASDNKAYGVHFHNDLDLALMNNIEAIKQGITLISTSWLGMAERNGLLRTELLTFLLSYEKELMMERFGFNGNDFFDKDNDLKYLKIIADKVSKYTGIPQKITDPIIGPGVNSISTGTPFVDPKSFQPFPPKEVLGIEQEILVTQLASKRVILKVAEQLGFVFNSSSIEKVLSKVKEKAYKENKPIIKNDELIEIFKKYQQL